MTARKVSHKSMRCSNVKLVLDVIRKSGSISRAEISRITGITKSTVSEIISFLQEKNIIIDVGIESSSKYGRKGILVDINSSEFLVVGYDIGTIWSRIVITDLNGEILRRKRFKTSEERLIDQIKDNVRDISSGLWEKIIGLGFSVPGMVDYKKGVIIHSPNLDLVNYPFINKVKKLFPGKKVLLDHNLKMMLLAEVEHGSGKGHKNVLVLNIGPGIGSAFTVDGKVARGTHNFSGEIGHITVDPNGDKCSCGKIGCLETVSSAWGIVRRYNSMSKDKVEGRFNSEEVAKRAKEGDNIAIKTFEDAGYYLGVVVAGEVNTVDPEIIIISGGLSNTWDLMEKSFIKAFESNVIRALKGKVKFALSKLGEYSTALGVATLTIEDFFNNVC